MTDEHEIEKLVAEIDANADPLHADFTPSVRRLGELGLPAARAVLPLFDADGWLTRLRAQRVLEQVINRRLGWVPGRGYADPQEGQQKLRTIWQANGGYDAKASKDARQRSMALWRDWLAAAPVEISPH